MPPFDQKEIETLVAALKSYEARVEETGKTAVRALTHKVSQMTDNLAEFKKGFDDAYHDRPRRPTSTTYHDGYRRGQEIRKALQKP